MEVRIVIGTSDRVAASQAARAAYSRIASLEDVFSDWRAASEIRQLVQRPAEWVPVSPALFDVLVQAVRLARLSGGAFDPTVGPLTALWRETRTSRTLPSADRLAEARKRTGWHHIALDSATRSVRVARAGMRIDLGGIAKGYILQEAGRTLAAAGLPAYLVEAGGDLVVGAAKAGTKGWRVVVKRPDGDTTLTLRDAAVATSGSSEQFVVVDGTSYSHIIDPRTGRGLTHMRQVTVISPRAPEADGLATALTILNEVDGNTLLSYYPSPLVFRSIASARP